MPDILPLSDLVLIKDDGSMAPVVAVVEDGFPIPVDGTKGDIPTFLSPVPKQVCWAGPKTFSADDMAFISTYLEVLSDQLSGLTDTLPPSLDSELVALKLL